jgi:hypothetical protein
MANVLTRNIWNCDSLGILSTTPVWVKGIMFTGTAQAHAFELKWWDEDSTTLNSGVITYTITTSTDDTITASGGTPLPNTWLDGNVIKCLTTTGSDTGVTGLIKTAGNNTVVVTHLSPFTAEAAMVGVFACYPTYTAFKGTQPTDTNEAGLWYPFCGERGFRFPNLALDSLSAGSIQIYLG